MFLLAEDPELSLAPEERYGFVPYNYGPMSKDLYADLDVLQTEGLVRRVAVEGQSWTLFRASPNGLDAAKRLVDGMSARDIPVARRLFERAPTPGALAALSVEEIDGLIAESTFHEPKARQIRDIATRTVEEFGGELPAEAEVLMSFKGVGPKCAHLALGVTTGQARVAVDVHVWRVTNRWGYVQAATPELAMVALEERLPRRYWVEINRLLVPFGKHVCTGKLPKCSTCPVLEYCRQVGVTTHR